MKPRIRKAHLGYHAGNVRVTADGDFLYFRERHSRQQTRISINDCIRFATPVAPVPQAEDVRQVPLPLFCQATA